MSNKTKFYLVILAGTLVITAGTILLFSYSRNYPDQSFLYYLFIGLSIVYFLAGVTIIIVWTSKLEE